MASPRPPWPGVVSISNCETWRLFGRSAHTVPTAAASAGLQPDVTRAAGGDQLDHLGVVDVLGAHLRGHLAQEQAGDRVRHLEDVVHVVRDQHDAEAVLREPADQVEHLLGLGHAEGGGRLVEDHELGVPQHGAGDRHGLALTAREAGDVLAQRPQRAHAERLQRLPGTLLHLGLVEREPGLHLATEEHVVHDVEVVAQREVLIDDLDPERVRVLRTVDRDRRALERHLAGVERVDASDALDQRALPGAVVPDEGGDFPRANVKIHVPEDVDGTEALVDPPQGQQLALLSLGSRCHPLKRPSPRRPSSALRSCRSCPRW